VRKHSRRKRTPLSGGRQERNRVRINRSHRILSFRLLRARSLQFLCALCPAVRPVLNFGPCLRNSHGITSLCKNEQQLSSNHILMQKPGGKKGVAHFNCHSRISRVNPAQNRGDVRLAIRTESRGTATHSWLCDPWVNLRLSICVARKVFLRRRNWPSRAISFRMCTCRKMGWGGVYAFSPRGQASLCECLRHQHILSDWRSHAHRALAAARPPSP
jgi:hypothetical protein